MGNRLLVRDFIAEEREPRQERWWGVHEALGQKKIYHFITYKAVNCGESAYARFGILFTHTDS